MGEFDHINPGDIARVERWEFRLGDIDGEIFKRFEHSDAGTEIWLEARGLSAEGERVKNARCIISLPVPDEFTTPEGAALLRDVVGSASKLLGKIAELHEWAAAAHA